MTFNFPHSLTGGGPASRKKTNGRYFYGRGFIGGCQRGDGKNQDSAGPGWPPSLGVDGAEAPPGFLPRRLRRFLAAVVVDAESAEAGAASPAAGAGGGAEGLGADSDCAGEGRCLGFPPRSRLRSGRFPLLSGLPEERGYFLRKERPGFERSSTNQSGSAQATGIFCPRVVSRASR